MRLIGLTVILALAIVPFVAETPETGNAAEAYRIGPEDVLMISVWKDEATSRSVLVRPDGKIALPLLNDVQAAGLTTLELRDVLIERFKEFIPSPEVSVIVTDVRSLKASAIDEVARLWLMRVPTRLPFQRFLPRPSPAPFWWHLGFRSPKPTPEDG
jgi:polysaccharide export outer membrane protein